MSEALSVLAINFAGPVAVILLLWGSATLIRDVPLVEDCRAFGVVLPGKGLRKTRSACADYVDRTFGFTPWPPKTKG